MAWEVDFWGRFRRAMVAAEDTLEANYADYNGAMVTLLGDVAKYYVQLRTDQKRIELVRANAALQRRVLEIARKRFQEGQTNDLGLQPGPQHAGPNRGPDSAVVERPPGGGGPLLRVDGHAPRGPRSAARRGADSRGAATVVVGIPADLLRRRPNVCRAERLAAAQAEQIGIAEVDLYPIFKLNGDMGYSAANTSQLFQTNAFYGAIGPGDPVEPFELRPHPQQHPPATGEVPGVRDHLPADRAPGGGRDGRRDVALPAGTRPLALLDESVSSMQLAVNTVVKQYEAGGIDFTRVSQIEQDFVQQQDAQAASHGQVAQGLIEVYRALGGGWQTRQGPIATVQARRATPPAPGPPAPPHEEIPIPPPAVFKPG